MTKINTRSKNRKINNKPFVIELSGTPNAGKDTQCLILKNFFSDVLHLRVAVIDEAYSSCKITGITNLEKFYWTIPVICHNLIFDRPPKYDVIIINRGIFDALCYLRFYWERNSISKQEETILADFLTSKKWSSKVDVVFILYLDPKISIERETLEQRGAINILADRLNRSKTVKPLGIINERVLTRINWTYKFIKEKYKEKFKKIYLLDDIDNADRESVSSEMIDLIKDEITKRWPSSDVYRSLEKKKFITQPGLFDLVEGYKQEKLVVI
jgi:hypothetical protein